MCGALCVVLLECPLKMLIDRFPIKLPPNSANRAELVLIKFLMKSRTYTADVTYFSLLSDADCINNIVNMWILNYHVRSMCSQQCCRAVSMQKKLW